MPGARHPRRPSKLPYDFEKDQVFDGYDPVEDGFGYPLDSDDSHEDCSCTVDPEFPERTALCERCIEQLNILGRII